MRYKFISTTNPKFTYLEGTSGELVYTEGYSAKYTTIDKWLITSVVNNIKKKGSIVTLTTLNSTYIFKKLGEKK